MIPKTKKAPAAATVTRLPSINPPADTLAAPRKPKFHWTLSRSGGVSKSLASAWGISPKEAPAFGVLSKQQCATPGELMDALRTVGRKISDFTDSPDQFAQIEITSRGFNVVCFSSYAATVEAHARPQPEAAISNPDATELAPCPFCRLADRLEIIFWADEKADGSEYNGDAVRCHRCGPVVPLPAWLTLPGAMPA